MFAGGSGGTEEGHAKGGRWYKWADTVHDTARVARFQGVPYRFAHPDPVAQNHWKFENPNSGYILPLEQQPYIAWLVRLANVAQLQGKTLAFVNWFPECIPATLISRSLQEMRAFISEHVKVVVKPLDQMGGQSVFVTDADDGNHNVILETVSGQGTRYTMIQRYVDAIAESGDKRIILIDGQPIPLALVRIPSPDEHRGNLATGARKEFRPLTQRDRWICEQVGPVLREMGLLFTGIDETSDQLP